MVEERKDFAPKKLCKYDIIELYLVFIDASFGVKQINLL